MTIRSNGPPLNIGLIPDRSDMRKVLLGGIKKGMLHNLRVTQCGSLFWIVLLKTSLMSASGAISVVYVYDFAFLSTAVIVLPWMLRL